MRFLLTRCSRCKTTFYTRVDEDGVEVRCPRCGEVYLDRVEEDRVKEVDFHWELDRDIYPPLKDELGPWDLLPLTGMILFLSIPFLLYPLLSGLFLSNGISGMTSTLLGILVGEGILTIFIVGAGISCLKRYSFPVAVAGPIILMFNTVLFIILSTDLLYTNIPIVSSWVLSIPFAISLFSLMALKLNRKRFDVF